MSFEEELIELLKGISKDLNSLLELYKDFNFDRDSCPNEFGRSDQCRLCDFRSQCMRDWLGE